MKRILITGGSGYIGSELSYKLKDVYSITSISRSDVDLEDSAEVNNWFKKKFFDVVIHTAIKGGNRLEEDTSSVMDSNLKMYYNLLNNRSSFDTFINLGSGAELYQAHKPYGLSKQVIRKSLLEKVNFYNLRIFAIFNENELDQRFIKNNIKRYIRKEPLQIHSNKLMDFFYFDDFVEILKYVIDSRPLQKEFNCTYKNKITLTDIADIINRLDCYTVLTEISETSLQQPYTGDFNLPENLLLTGLEQGIKNVFNIINEIN